MSSHPYVTQQNTPLAGDTTLMSTTDLQSYITHANDTFVQVSGFTLQELLKGSRTTWCVTRICQKRRLRICGSP